MNSIDYAFIVRNTLRELSPIMPAGLVYGSILLLRRFGGAPAVLLVIGSSAFLLEYVIDVGLTYLLMPYVVEHPNSNITRALWPSCTPQPAFDYTRNISHLIGVVCFCLGFFWFCFRMTRRT